MRKLAFVAVVVVVAAGVLFMSRCSSDQAPPAGAQAGGRSGGAGAAPVARGNPNSRGFRPPMTVNTAQVGRSSLTEYVTVVGNLIGAATVQVVPKVNGRLESIAVQLADPVRKGQRIAKVEDREIAQQVKQAQASFEVSGASVRQREADLKFAEVNLERSRSLYERQLMPKQSLDDADARYQAAVAQLDLARAQYSQAKARLDELEITLANTEIVSPVDGFVGKRFLDPGAFTSQNSPIVSVVDIGYVRLVANLVEKDVKRVTAGVPAVVEVDAFPGERFDGHVSRVAPVFDPATRTAEMEIEVPNPGFRLKPGMYARVRLKVADRPNALTVPAAAVVFTQNQKGVFIPTEGNVAQFQAVEFGLQDDQHAEVLSGIDEGATVIATGASALKEGDRYVLAAEDAGERGAQPAGATGGRRGQRGGAPQAEQPGQQGQ